MKTPEDKPLPMPPAKDWAALEAQNRKLDDIGEEAEWEAFRAAIIEAFGALRPLRQALQHPANQNAALAMAQQFGQALKDAEEWRAKP
jgi:hypothetical protein